MTDDTELGLKDLFKAVPAVATLLGGFAQLQGGRDAAAGNRKAGDAAAAAAERAAQAALDAGERQAASDLVAGQRARDAKTFEARQYEQQAVQQEAAAQRAAAEQRRQSSIQQSRAIAVAAASGAGATDPSVVTHVSRMAGMGRYNSNLALYQGEEAARQLRMHAVAAQFTGLTAEEAGGMNSANDLAKWKATAEAERAKGVVAKDAAELAARAALHRGNVGAAQTLLPLGASLLEKYGEKLFLSASELIKGGSARDNGVDMTEEEAAAASKAWGDWEEQQAIANAEADARWTVDTGVEWESAAMTDTRAEAASAAESFEWLMLF